jgi:hypothetical protein
MILYYILLFLLSTSFQPVLGQMAHNCSLTDRINRQAVILGQLFSGFTKFGEQGEIFGAIPSPPLPGAGMDSKTGGEQAGSPGSCTDSTELPRSDWPNARKRRC